MLFKKYLGKRDSLHTMIWCCSVKVWGHQVGTNLFNSGVVFTEETKTQ
jgi:hypothetical protein